MEMYPEMTEETFNHILENLQCAKELYLYDTPLSELILAIRSALFLENKAGLQEFIKDSRELVKKLERSNYMD